MTPDSTATPTVLLVDDDRDLVDAYASQLDGRYTIRVAYTGEEALDRLDPTVDVVLLDRRLPDHSGEEILAEIREDGYDCRVALVTGVEPDFDIIEMACDDYLTKPVSERALIETTERLLTVGEFDHGLQKLFSWVSTAAALESQKPPAELERSEEYAELRERIDEMESKMEDLRSSLPPDHLFGVALDHSPPDVKGRP